MSTLEIQQRHIGAVTVLDLDGDIRIGAGNIALQKALRCLTDEGRNQVILNLALVTKIDSSGLGELVSGHFLLKQKGGRIKLLNLRQNLLELMTITKLTSVFDIYDNESEALDSFKLQDVVAVPIAPSGQVETIIASP